MPVNKPRPDLERFFTFWNKTAPSAPARVLIQSFADSAAGGSVLTGATRVVRLSADATHGTGVKRPPTVVFRLTAAAPGAPIGAGFELNTLSFGEIVADLTWQTGFSPRLYDRPSSASSDDGLPSVLAFVPFPDPASAAAPVGGDVFALSGGVGTLATPANRRPRGIPLREWADMIETAYGVPIRADAHLLDVPAVLNFPTPVSLAYVLDALALYLGAYWDWAEDAAVFRSRALCPGCDDRLATR